MKGALKRFINVTMHMYSVPLTIIKKVKEFSVAYVRFNIKLLPSRKTLYFEEGLR